MKSLVFCVIVMLLVTGLSTQQTNALNQIQTRDRSETSMILGSTETFGRNQVAENSNVNSPDGLIAIMGINWYFHDTGTGQYGSNYWGQQASALDLVERMDGTAPTATGSSQAILGSNIPYYAAATAVTANYSNYSFKARLNLESVLSSQSDSIHVSLIRGVWNSDGSITESQVLCSASQFVNSTTITEYSITLGSPPASGGSLSNESLIVKIWAENSGRTKIYWDDSSYKSRLYGTPMLHIDDGCIPGSGWEDEPVPYDEYNDHSNGGCNSDPQVYGATEPQPQGTSQNICGTSGTYYVAGEARRDTDWYEVNLVNPGPFGFSVVADFPLFIALLSGDQGCTDPPIIEMTSAGPGEHVGIWDNLAPGTYWVFIAPSIFEGVPCGAEYYLSLVGNWLDPEPAVCCLDNQCYLMIEPECEGNGGEWIPYLSSCDPDPCEPDFPLVWYFDDTGVYGWGQTYVAPKWEWMDSSLGDECVTQDLDTENPYYACSAPLDLDYSGYRFYADLWLDNNYEDHANPITLELRRGGWENQGTLIATATGTCTTYMGNPPDGKYLFDFGVIPNLNLDNESLIVKIIYNGDPGDTHIKWDGEFCASALYAVGPGNPGPDIVVCEVQGGDNPTHPNTFWYDVTPTDFGRCDFHVRVYDPDPANYSNVSLPAASWQFAVHNVDGEWWASWYDPQCLNAIFDTFRFQFDNTSGRAWGEWTTTIGAGPDPYYWVIDFSGRHFLEPDGYGYRVHVPDGIHAHYLDHNVGEPTLTMTDQGILGFMDDTQTQGSGLIYPAEGNNLLYVGSLWVGLSDTYVANRDYSADPATEWTVSATPDGRAWETALGEADQEIHAAYNDNGAASPAGLFVEQESWAWASNEVTRHHVMVEYQVSNLGDDYLEDVYIGCYLDLDIGENYQENTGGTAAQYNLVYMTDVSGVHAGVQLLTDDMNEPPLANLTLVHNPTHVWPLGYMPDDDRYGFLSADGEPYIVPDAPVADDYSVLASAGPFALEPGQQKTVTFAIVGGESYDELPTHALAAQMIFSAGYSGVEDKPIENMSVIYLQAPSPNPFEHSTVIRFELPQVTEIDLGVYDVGGRLVRGLAAGQFPAASHSLFWDGCNGEGQPVPGGVYFLRLDTRFRQETKRIIRVR